ncbi:hypothetical protein, partial [Geobacillus sp. WSUCF-018B]|uniref:hypothetical protein n=1 Tax=Geobacillus sp. WSUCF-018B TaxID=2055939 RepID=UPI001E342F07
HSNSFWITSFFARKRVFSVRYMVSPPMFIVFYCHPKKKEKNRKTERHSSPTYRGGGLLANLC